MFHVFICLVGFVLTPPVRVFSPDRLREQLSPSENLFYLSLPSYFTLLLLFYFLFQLLSSACCALLGRFGCCLGRSDDRTPSIMQNVSTVTAWQPWRAASASCTGGLDRVGGANGLETPKGHRDRKWNNKKTITKKQCRTGGKDSRGCRVFPVDRPAQRRALQLLTASYSV